ncbi:hypothetical protein A2U01_0021765 [Trifolium medium]|uniref:Uncharacterized protein n=1 Tax=Trifolium medium TaxID=97028 RepID=A0A392NLQ9_9FABA|nr:hypothetical protein [Trifolium medium]
MINNEEQVKAQKLVYAALWDKANVSNNKVEQMKKQTDDIVSGVNACKENIANWTSEIQDLQIKIAELECKIISENAKKRELESKAGQITKDEIDKEARIGIEHYASAKVIDGAINQLNEENDVLVKKMKVTKEFYDKLRAPLLKK